MVCHKCVQLCLVTAEMRKEGFIKRLVYTNSFFVLICIFFPFKICFYVCLACKYVHHVYAAPIEARRGCKILWDWSYGWL